ncbi:MAG TPA: hypothetical protein VKH41_02930 [Myxococcota bacterium]|nr:hypothetical protein [Myxococcota bacterium]
MKALAALAFVFFALLASGCFAPLKQLVHASAIEQQLTSAAIARSVAALPVEGIDHRNRYVLRIAAPKGVDTSLIRARLEQRLADVDIRLQPERAARGPELLAEVPFAGADSEVTLIGVPFVVPGLPVALGDISLYKSSTVTGRARVELSAWSRDRARVTSLPAVEASRYYRNVTFLTFIGPFRFSNLDEPLPGDEP